MALTGAPKFVCSCCLTLITIPEELVPHPTIKQAYLDICKTCLLTEARVILHGGASLDRQVA